MAKKPFEPNFRTPKDEQAGVENIKRNSLFVHREVAIQMRENDHTDVSIDVEQYAKSFGIYLEFDRRIKGRDHEWFYMIRIANPTGGPIDREQWQAFDELSEKYTGGPDNQPSLRFTTRQAIQFHWVSKAGVLDIIKTLAEKDKRSINGCGDNTRNVMACPLSPFSDVFRADQWCQKAADYFQLPLAPYMKIFKIDPEYVREPEGGSFKYGPNLLNRKFKIGFSTLHKDLESGKVVPDNCIEMRTNDLGVAPIWNGKQVSAFQIYVGGGQGERNGYPTMATLSTPFGIVTEEQLLPTMDAIVATHQEWGDRENRHWARLKYVIKKQGVEWLRDQVTGRTGFPLQKPNPDHDYGDRHLHFGWSKQPSNNKWAYGVYIENGRITDYGTNGKIKTMIREVMNKYDTKLFVTANQDVIFTDIEDGQKEEFVADLKSYGYGERNGKPYSELRLRSGACVGRDTCRLTYTDSEKLEPELLDKLEEMGWGDMKESIGITGCERQCFRPATKTLGIIGTGMDRYTFKFFGDETARHQGKPLVDPDGTKMYLRFVLRDQLPILIDALFKDYTANKNDGESLGAYHRRIENVGLIKALSDNSATAPLMEKTFHTDFELENT